MPAARKMEPAITLAVLPGDTSGYGGNGGGALNESHGEPYDALLKIVLVSLELGCRGVAFRV
jgi:hypothetical protein